MAQKGLKPLAASPAAKRTACSSAMPTSKYLSGMMRLEAVEAGAVGHGGGDGDHLVVEIGQLHHGVGEHFGIGAAAERRGLAGFGIVGTKAVKLLLLLQGRLETLSLLGEHVQEHGAVLLLEIVEGLDQRADVVTVDGAEVLQAQLFEDDAGPQHSLGDLFGFSRHTQGGHAADLLDEFAGAIVQIFELRAGDDLVQVTGDGPDVLVDGPLVVVQHDDQPLGVVGDIVQGFVGNPAGEGGVSRDGDDMFLAAGLIAGDGHAERRGERRAGVTRAVGIVRAFRAQHEPVQSARSTDGVKLLLAAGEQLVHIGLVADVEQEAVVRRLERRNAGRW